MARDFNALADAAHQKKETERNERYQALATDIVGLIDDVLESTFPMIGDAPDWDKFNWTKAEALKQLLADFQSNRTRGNESAVSRRERQPARTTTDATTPVEPATTQADADSPSQPKRRVREFGRKVWSNS